MSRKIRIKILVLLLTFGAAHAENARLYLQLGHSGTINSVALSPDGRYALTGSADATARLWDLRTGQELRRLEGHSEVVESVAISPDGAWGLTGSVDGTARLWDLKSGREIRRLVGHSRPVISVAISPDGHYALTGSGDHTARWWDLRTGKEIRRLVGHSQMIDSVAISSDGQWALTGGEDQTARLWDLKTGREIRRFERHTDTVDAVAFSPDGRWVLTGSWDHTARLWDSTTGAEIRRLEGHSDWVTSVQIFSDGQRALTGSNDGTARIWDLRTGRQLQLVQPGGSINSVALSPGGSLALTGGDTIAQLVDLRTGQEIRRLEGLTKSVHSVAISSDAHWLMTAPDDPAAEVWDLRTGRVDHLTGHSEPAISVAISANNNSVLTGGYDETARVWDPQTLRLVRTLKMGYSNGLTSVSSVAISADGRLALVGGEDKIARLYDLNSGQQIHQLEGHSKVVEAVAISPDGRWGLTGSVDNTARLWDLSSGKEMRRLEGHSNSVEAVALSSDGRWALTGSQDMTARLWDLRTGQQVQILKGHSNSVDAVAIFPDGNFALTGSWDRTARLWDLRTGQEIRRLEGHSGTVSSVAISADGRWALTGSWDGSTRIWEVASGKWLATLVSFADGNWAVVDPLGRYDASAPDNSPGLYWVTDHLHTVGLGQLRRSFYTPGLLRRIMQHEVLPDVIGLNEGLKLPPDVKAQIVPTNGGPALRLQLEDPGEGIGRTVIKINGRRFPTALLSSNRKGQVETRDYSLTAANFADGENKIVVSAYGIDNQIESAPATLDWTASDHSRGFAKVEASQPHDSKCKGRFYGIFVGVSNFADVQLNLRYPADDAEALAQAVRLGAEALCGADNVDITVLTNRQTENTKLPTKQNVRAALERVAAHSTRNDLLFIYLAGHGATPSNDKRSYFFLTQDARSVDVDIADKLRDATSISSQELVAWLRNPKLPDKQVVILDTCAAGAAGEQLSLLAQPREVADDLKKAVDNWNQDTGTFILMGSAQNRASYESERFGHGLLTYALLHGMRGDALLDGSRLEAAHWFDVTVAAVAQYARMIGREQDPQKAIPVSSGGLPLGFLPEELRRQIVLAEPAPEILKLTACYQTSDSGALTDPLKLTALIRSELRTLTAAAERGSESPVSYNDNDSEESSGSFVPQVRYQVTSGSSLRVNVALLSQEKIGDKTLDLSTDNLPISAKQIAQTIVTLAAAQR